MLGGVFHLFNFNSGLKTVRNTAVINSESMIINAHVNIFPDIMKDGASKASAPILSTMESMFIIAEANNLRERLSTSQYCEQPIISAINYFHSKQPSIKTD